jgi:hypothetical protein
MPRNSKRVICGVLATLAFTRIGSAANGFSCRPSHLKRGDTLVISMPIPHGGDLAVWAPDRKFLFLVFWTTDSSEVKLPLRDWEAFKHEATLRLDTTTAEATPWPERSSRALIFSTAGWYKFVLDDNLETEGTPKYSCRVHFEGRT